MNTIDVVERSVMEHSTVWAAYAKSLHRKIAKLRKANRELEASYRKLAEREKALTEALEWYVREDDCTNVPENGYWLEGKARAEAALALHKEDA